ncbi:MAG: hypothetical protein KDK70_09305, partial [Myxococcales bacterium]|nr:hypothetical protein [Myxococcales bacterium]
MHEVWSRVREGRHVVVVGTLPPLPETQPGEPRWAVVRVGCDGAWSTWGPLEDARRRIEALLGEQSPRWDEALDRMGTSARFLGDLPEPTIEATLVGAANRLAERFEGRAALVIESLDEADEATVQALRDILERAGWMRLPLVLGLGQVPEHGPLAELLGRIEGDPVAAGPKAEPTGFDWSSLRPELLLVMRAAAVVGRSFEAELVARLLGVSADAVLMRLQQAADLGAPLADHGGGRFFIPEAAQRALVQRVLPSLVERWHRRLGEILAEPPRPVDADVDEPRAPDPASYEEASGSEGPGSGGGAGASEAGETSETREAGETREASETGETGETEGPDGADEADEADQAGGADGGGEVAEGSEPPSPPVGTLGHARPSAEPVTATYDEILEPAGEDRLSAKPADEPAVDEPAVDEPAASEPEHDAAETMRLDPEEVERLLSPRAAADGARDQARAAHHLSEAGLPERAVEQYLAALRK